MMLSTVIVLRLIEINRYNFILKKVFRQNEIIFLILLVLFLNFTTFPQKSNYVYSTTRINLNIVFNKSTGELNHLWNARNGFEGSIEWPFYYGIVVAGLRFLPYKAKGNIHNNIASVFYFAGWGKEIKFPLNLGLYNGFKVGAFEMSYDGPGLSPEQHNKLQLSAGVNSRLSLRLFQHWYSFISADYEAVFTKIRIELFLISTGFSYSFTTPRWLKNFLK